MVRKVGTPVVEKAAKMITEETGRNEGVVMKILRIVVEEAKKKESKAKINFRRDRRNAEKTLPAGWMRKRFAEILRAEAQSCKKRIN